MKTGIFKKAISILLAALMLASLLSVLTASAEEAGQDPGGTDIVPNERPPNVGLPLIPNLPPEEAWRAKIDPALWEVLNDVDDDEEISVWIWFTDIDQDALEKQVEKKTGLTRDTLAVEYAPVPDDLIRVLNLASEGEYDDEGEVARRMQAYVAATEPQRKLEQQRTDTYTMALRNAGWDAYTAANGAKIRRLQLPENEIIFQSSLTPSVIVTLPKSRILETAQSADVESVSYYDVDSEAPPQA